MRRNARRNAFDEIAVRIDQRTAAPVLDVLPDQRLNQRRLADAGLADHVHMRKPVGLLDAEDSMWFPRICPCERRDLVRVMLHRLSLPVFDLRPRLRHMPIEHVVPSLRSFATRYHSCRYSRSRGHEPALNGQRWHVPRRSIMVLSNPSIAPRRSRSSTMHSASPSCAEPSA